MSDPSRDDPSQDRQTAPSARGPWPRWPSPAPEALENLRLVLDSGRWTISGPYAGGPSMEQRFGEAFAAYHGVPHCVPTASGTASLLIAFEALGIRPGDEVLIPGLTWVACATAVANLGAVPVLVDVEPDTLCIAPDAIEKAITPATRAILAVHLYSAVADLGRLRDIAERHGLELIEDCAQAHGAVWEGRRVGTVGRLGVFSMQQGKVLTCGEGGAVLTREPELYRRLQQLRADGRVLAPQAPAIGDMELLETGEVTGSNRCLSELHAAVLLAQLSQLEEQNRHRRRNARRLDELLRQVGWHPQTSSAGTTARTYYRYVAAFDEEELDGAGDQTGDRIAEALSGRLGFRVMRTYLPLNRSPLYRPSTRTRYHIDASFLRRLDPSRFALPECDRAWRRCLTLPHSVLLAEPERMEQIAQAFDEVRSQRARWI